MKRDTQFEAKIFETVHALGRHWMKVLKSPSAKMLEKHPILPDILPYVYAQTHKLDDPEFEYTLLTRLAWLYNGYDDFGICENCGSKIIHWNFTNYKDQYKKTCSKKCERKLAQKQSTEHFLKTYGVKNAFQIPDVIDRNKARHDEWLEKCIKTKKAHKTFNTSLPEEAAFQALEFKYKNVLRQYKSDKYPFSCDFYIPAEDLYIECNFSWTHGGRPFDPSDEWCKNQLADWQADSTDYYQNAITTWTVRDVKKREAAKELNWKEFWTLDELIVWIDCPRCWEKFSCIYDEDFPLTVDGLLENQQYFMKQKALKASGYRCSGNCTRWFADQIIATHGKEAHSKIQAISFPAFFEHVPTSKDFENELEQLVMNSKGTRQRSALIKSFHQQTFKDSARRGRLSPQDYWQQAKDDYMTFVQLFKNRLLYSDWYKGDSSRLGLFVNGVVPEHEWLVGMTASHIAPLVSYFKPALAKRLVEDYLNRFDEVYDPFSGMSGRLLGTLASGKKYIGADVNPVVVAESKQLMDVVAPIFKKLGKSPKWELSVADALCTTAKAQCVLTCSPYRDLETWNGSTAVLSCDEWIDVILKNVEAQRYVFVTDQDLEKYRPYVKEELENHSHLGTNKELVVVIDRSELNL